MIWVFFHFSDFICSKLSLNQKNSQTQTRVADANIELVEVDLTMCYLATISSPIGKAWMAALWSKKVDPSSDYQAYIANNLLAISSTSS